MREDRVLPAALAGICLRSEGEEVGMFEKISEGKYVNMLHVMTIEEDGPLMVLRMDDGGQYCVESDNQQALLRRIQTYKRALRRLAVGNFNMREG